jgi:hypothetical protein
MELSRALAEAVRDPRHRPIRATTDHHRTPGTGEDTRHRGPAVSGATGIESALASSGRLLTTSHGEVMTNCCNRW